MNLTLEKYTAVTAWNYGHTHEKGCLQLTGLCFGATINMTPDEMESLAFELQTTARVCREMADAKLNAEIAELDVKYPKVA